MSIAVFPQSEIESTQQEHGIRRIAVIGSGLMGAGIAAHCANAGCEVLLMDIVPKGAQERNVLAMKALDEMATANPEVLMHPDFAGRITAGNLEDDLELLADRDWVVEVVVERVDI